MYILGSGMAGCLAATLNPTATILEAAISPPDNHSAVLRFRTDNISKVTGIPFKKVHVHKSIWYKGKHYRQADPHMANLYSQKVAGKILPRSIWDLSSVDRFIAPPDFHMKLLERLNKRIVYGAKVTDITKDNIFAEMGNTAMFARNDTAIISTMPMPVLADVLGEYDSEGLVLGQNFHHAPIYTERWEVADCDVHQTVYFPSDDTPMYRATLTGNALILEGTHPSDHMIDHACFAFGIINIDRYKLIKRGELKYGKIAPIDESVRKNFMFKCTHELGIFSLGRFATWKNLLMDDVYDDIFTIRRMIGQSAYDLRKEF
jgi:hypothetical protein